VRRIESQSVFGGSPLGDRPFLAKKHLTARTGKVARQQRSLPPSALAIEQAEKMVKHSGKKEKKKTSSEPRGGQHCPKLGGKLWKDGRVGRGSTKKNEKDEGNDCQMCTAEWGAGVRQGEAKGSSTGRLGGEDKNSIKGGSDTE